MQTTIAAGNANAQARSAAIVQFAVFERDVTPSLVIMNPISE